MDDRWTFIKNLCKDRAYPKWDCTLQNALLSIQPCVDAIWTKKSLTGHDEGCPG